MINNIKSPITGGQTDCVLKIKSSHIVALYRSQLNVDVTKYFVGIDEIQIQECKDTSYRFYHPFSLAGDGDFYPQIKNSFKGNEYYPTWKEEFQIAKDLIPKGAKVLDVGCGDGLFLNGIKDITTNSFGIDFSEKAIEYAKGLGLKAACIDMKQLYEQDRDFDFVCSFQVLEHITDIKGFLDEALRLLKPGGKLIIAVPDNSPYIYGKKILGTLNLPPHHMGLWNINSFKKMPEYFPIKFLNANYCEKSSFIHSMFVFSTYYLYKIFGFDVYKHRAVQAIFSAITAPISFLATLYDWATGNTKHHAIVCCFEKK